jgi:GT2 family glycosyltransferase
VKVAVVIPHYNHGAALGHVLAGLGAVREGLTSHDVPCIVVDDGSDAANRAKLAELAARWPWMRLESFPANRGRGAALRRGYEVAFRDGFSHVVQLDADGQHDPADVPRFVEAARRHPAALVLGVPDFDDTAPRSRLHGRRVTTFWVAIETLSRVVPDALCGFRVIPLGPTMDVLARHRLGDRMEFDPALVVWLVWTGVPIATVRTRVRYHANGVSHFEPWRDNVRISAMHAGLVLRMLGRAPALVRRRPVRYAGAER